MMTCTPKVRFGRDAVYVSFDDGRSWWVVRPDGTTELQFRWPAPGWLTGWH